MQVLSVLQLPMLLYAPHVSTLNSQCEKEHRLSAIPPVEWLLLRCCVAQGVQTQQQVEPMQHRHV